MPRGSFVVSATRNNATHPLPLPSPTNHTDRSTLSVSAAVPGGGGGRRFYGSGALAHWVAGLNVSQVFETGIWVFHVGSSAVYRERLH